MSWFRFTLWSVVILAALMTGFLGWVAVRRGLAPLHAIKLEAAAITADRLHSRLATESIPIELVDLAETLNQMLARLEDSFRRLSDFSSDIAHELRTPVSNLLTQTQVMLLRVRTIDEYQDVLASNAEELERMAKMIADMLFLAKADNNLVVPNLEAVDLRAEAEGLASFYEAVAEENSVALTVNRSATVTGDRLMLRRAIGNLLSNAFGHTPEEVTYEFRSARMKTEWQRSRLKTPARRSRQNICRVSLTVSTGQTLQGNALPMELVWGWRSHARSFKRMEDPYRFGRPMGSPYLSCKCSQDRL